MKFLQLVKSFFNLRVFGMAILAGFRKLGINLKIVKTADGNIQAVPANDQDTTDRTLLK